MATAERPDTYLARVIAVAIALILGIAMIPPAEATGGPVDFCLKHPVKGTYRLTTVGAPAVPVLSEKPGGGLVGDPIPDQEGYVFGPDCEALLIGTTQSPPPTTTTTTTTPPPTTSSTTTTTSTSTTTSTTSTTTTTTQPPTTTTTTTQPPTTTTTTTTTTTQPPTTTTTTTQPPTTTTTTTQPPTTTTTTTLPPPPTPDVIARAWTVDGSGDEVLIAQLTDTDFSGTPTAGDIVSTAYYPLTTAGSSFGAFGVTHHVISGGLTGTDADGAALVAAWAPCGDMECRFEWAVFDDGTRRYERYSEFFTGDGASSTGRTGLRDTIDPTCLPESCDSTLFQFDVVSINPSSPSSPTHFTYDGIVSSTDDTFLDVSIG